MFSQCKNRKKAMKHKNSVLVVDTGSLGVNGGQSSSLLSGQSGRPSHL